MKVKVNEMVQIHDGYSSDIQKKKILKGGMKKMTARQFLEWAGFEVTEENLCRLRDYVGSDIDFSQFPDANVVTEDGTPLNECAEEPVRFQEWMDGFYRFRI